MLPIGVAAVCRNCRFQLTTVATRYGLQTAMQGPNQAPISGLASLIYTPENPGETSFEAPLLFDTSGFLLIESPAGSGRLKRIQGPLVSQPAGAHAIIAQCYNRALIAFSDLETPKAPIEVYGLKSQTLDPYGQKPIGGAWLAATPYLVNEYVQPVAAGGNGHLYQCIQAGTTGGTEPGWPLGEGATVADGGVIWKEMTPVLANRLPAPNSPGLARIAGGGSFAAGRDVYVVGTYVNAQGESIPSGPGVARNTQANDAVQSSLPSLSALPGWIQGLQGQYRPTAIQVYEADVAAGDAAPPRESYALVGSFALGAAVTIADTASGAAPPDSNSARITPGGNIAPDTAPGLRYASIAFTNRNGNLSGTVPAFTSADVDVLGFELYMANIPIGPGNVLNRTIGFTVADGTNVGPFFYIPSDTVSSGIPMTSTVIPDNTATTAFFNFTDEFLEAETSTDMTDRLRVIQPPPAVDVYYAPSIDRVVLTGVDGYASGHYISLAADSESFYGDTSPIQVANGNGQRCICAREYLGTLYSLKERSGFVISPTATDPSTWSVQQRWEGVGPCGPRAVAVTNEFLLFVHRSGVYCYSTSSPQPELVTKELPNLPGSFWSTINWDAEETIWCSVDEENKEIRIGLPVGRSTVPNLCLTMNYSEGLSGPIHFSEFAGKELALGGARKWSVDDIQGYTAVRCERRLAENTSPFASFRQSQILIASSAPDGTVQAIVPGIYNDNGQGIDCQYETVCDPGNMAVSMLGGVSINALGEGLMNVSVMVARSFVTSPGGGQQGETESREIKLAPFRLTPENWKGYSGGARGQNERFRCRFTNGKAADAWFGLKYVNLYTRPLFSGRTASSF